MNAYQNFIYKRTYSRWNYKQNRRETFNETVSRYIEFFKNRFKTHKNKEVIYNLLDSSEKLINSLSIMPSMRALWSAGGALEIENAAGYNCAYTTIRSIKDFADIMYILMCGVGIGFSVENKYIKNLPIIKRRFSETDKTIVFEDSKKGWAEGFYEWLTCLFNGEIPSYDLSKIRKKGAILKTFGGRASGAEPLKSLLEFTKEVIKGNAGKQLSSVNVADIVCKISEIVVVGGVRRSATMCLTDASDNKMAYYKEGKYWEKYPYRALANISLVYEEPPIFDDFLIDWMNILGSNTGERGIINRHALKEKAKAIGREVRDFGVNPCGEIILRDKQFCNLTEVVLRDSDEVEDIQDKIKYATFLGVIQSTLTDFNFISEEYKNNSEEERLLGVSLTGLADCKFIFPFWLRRKAKEYAKEFADLLGINHPVAVTTIKPSGTVSQLVNSSSGIHPIFSEYYIRRVRISTSDPLFRFLVDEGFEYKPEVGQNTDDCSTAVFEFPVKSTPNSVTRKDMNALTQCKIVKDFYNKWCDHNVSCTIYVKDHEWFRVGEWVFDNINEIGGMSFLPFDNGVYQLAPYEEITKEQYEEMLKKIPNVDYSKLSFYEKEDYTLGSKEYACVGGACEF